MPEPYNAVKSLESIKIENISTNSVSSFLPLSRTGSAYGIDFGSDGIQDVKAKFAYPSENDLVGYGEPFSNVNFELMNDGKLRSNTYSADMGLNNKRGVVTVSNFRSDTDNNGVDELKIGSQEYLLDASKIKKGDVYGVQRGDVKAFSLDLDQDGLPDFSFSSYDFKTGLFSEDLKIPANHTDTYIIKKDGLGVSALVKDYYGDTFQKSSSTPLLDLVEDFKKKSFDDVNFKFDLFDSSGYKIGTAQIEAEGNVVSTILGEKDEWWEDYNMVGSHEKSEAAFVGIPNFEYLKFVNQNPLLEGSRIYSA